MKLFRPVLACCLWLTLAVHGWTADSSPKEADLKALDAWQGYVGNWKGAGQPQRSSTKGAWTEKSDWAWHFHDGHAALQFQSADGKLFSGGSISPGKEPGTYQLVVKRAGQSAEERFSGRKNDAGQFVFDRLDSAAATTTADGIARLTFRQVAEGNRLLVLVERRAGENTFTRMAEIGYTRQGIQFAAGGGEPECVVTGGKGTIAVKHDGQTYYVCCTGCKDLFEADPAGILAEYKAKKAKKAAP